MRAYNLVLILFSTLLLSGCSNESHPQNYTPLGTIPSNQHDTGDNGHRGPGGQVGGMMGAAGMGPMY